MTRRNAALGIFTISASALAFEITLTRIFAVQQFHHFAFLVVSLAVMGFAASGSLLTFRPTGHPLARLSAVFSASVLLAYLIINFLPFDSYSIAWDPLQVWVLIAYFLGSAAPFLFAGWVIGAQLRADQDQAHVIYASNLAGSAFGVGIGLLGIGAERTILLCVALGLLAAGMLSSRRSSRLVVVSAALLFGVGAMAYPPQLELRLSPYKPLSLARQAPDARQTIKLWGPVTRVDVVESASTHVFPGLSLNADISLPEQVGLFIDGDGPLPLTAPSSELAGFMPGSIAYQLRPEATALVLQPGGGLEAQVALGAGVGQLYIAQDYPLAFPVMSGTYAEHLGQLYADPRVRLVSLPSRAALRAGNETYDVIDFALTDAFRPVASGAFSLSENYAMTVESIREALQRLSPDGLLVITRWVGTPPSESARAWATVLEAMGGDSAQDRLVAFRGMRTATILVSPSAFSSDELATIRGFLARNAYDPVWLPDLQEHELNLHNRLPAPIYHTLFVELLERPNQTLASYDFNLQPPTDDRPYFFHYFRWRQTPTVLATLGTQWQPFGGSGYFVLVALLALVGVLAVALLLIPRLARRRGRPPGLSYFAFLGIAYLMVEIPLIVRLTLWLDRPALSLGIVLFTLLLGSGIGSWFSAGRSLSKVLAVLTGLLALGVLAIPGLISATLHWPLFWRLALAIMTLFPAGVLMGIPFARGLALIDKRAIPWAWAINGAFSGVSGVLSAILLLDFGFRASLALGALAYLGALLVAPRLRSS
jgi:hypothetical protein